MFEMKVKCPECGRIWIVPQGTPDITCNCHTYCPDGSKPSDCNVSAVSFSGKYSWPSGLHVAADDDSDDVTQHNRYCSVHGRYFTANPVLIECDWARWYSKRAPKELRMSHGEY